MPPALFRRKNLFYLVKWFMEVFDNDPDVGLIIKTSRGRNHAIDKKYTQKLFKNYKNMKNLLKHIKNYVTLFL